MACTCSVTEWSCTREITENTRDFQGAEANGNFFRIFFLTVNESRSQAEEPLLVVCASRCGVWQAGRPAGPNHTPAKPLLPMDQVRCKQNSLRREAATPQFNSRE